jgi:hypothetical protein
VPTPLTFSNTLAKKMGTKYLGLRGNGLVRFMLGVLVFPSYFLVGYNLTVAGGVLTLDSFVATFPRIDTVNTTGAQKADNSLVQGA